MKNLTILTQSLGAADNVRLRGGVVRIPVGLPPHAAFIQRSMAMRDHFCGQRATVLVDEHAAVLPRPQVRMLQRTAMGLGADVQGEKPWYGLSGVQSANPGPGIGNWDGDILLLGDSNNPSAPEHAPSWPMISPSNDGVAAWFCELLDVANVQEARLYWANVMRRSGGTEIPIPAEQILARPWKAVVTFGRTPLWWCRQNGLRVDHEGMHPAYWWSRRRNHRYPMMDFLAEVVK